MLLSLLGDSDVHRQLISMCLCWCWRCATAAATLSMQLLLCAAQRLAPSCWMADCSTAAHRYFFRLWPRKNTVCCFGRQAYTVQAAQQAPDSNAGLSPASAAVKLARGAGLTWPGCCEWLHFLSCLQWRCMFYSVMAHACRRLGALHGAAAVSCKGMALLPCTSVGGALAQCRVGVSSDT